MDCDNREKLTYSYCFQAITDLFMDPKVVNEVLCMWI
jgi:hypothetical protein